METLKQRTIDGVNYTLERQQTDTMGKQYEYMVRAGRGQGGRTKTFNPSQNYYRRDEAEQLFSEVVSSKQRSAGRNRNRERQQSRGGFGMQLFGGGGGGGGGGGPMLPGMGGGGDMDGGGPMIPGFGMGMDDDDDEPQFPWF